MEKLIAIKLLTDTLQKPFDEAQFQQFARNLVNDLDESKAFQAQGNYIKDAYKHQVRQYKRIGQYVDPDDNTIDVLVVRLQQPTSLDRARTMQRNFIAQYLQDRGQKEAALVAYTTDGSIDWRFSLVRLDYRLEVQADGSYKPKKEVTAARRSSFLVGQTEPNHTAQQQLLPLLLNDRQNPTLDELEAAFNIESVTKEFFEQYKSLFLRVQDEIETLLQIDPVIAADFTQKQIDPANFAKKLLGQIVFLYFLQKKGWLGVEPGHPWGSGAKDFLRRLFDKENVEYDNFFNDVLEPLFYQALAVDRGSGALYELPGCPQSCKIPFLNGGLFEPIGGYDWRTTNVLIANDTIQKVLDTFDLYNFTVREDEPLDKEVAVDPEMLGKVFENLLEVSDRKSKGAFYTPREIVHYMCQESLINYLDTTMNRQVVEILPPSTQQTSLFAEPTAGQLSLTQEEYCERVPRGDLERLIRQGEGAIANDAVVMQRGGETPTYQFRVPESVRTHAAAIDQALAAIKICDPAIGSGAFPVGMMQEIVKVREVLTTYLTLTPSPNPLPRERASGSPPSPQGEGDRGDEGDPVAGKLRLIPRALLERARELRSRQTSAEQILWECLRDRRLNNFKFRRQHNIGQYIADFYCHEAKLVVELDGGIHQTQTGRDRDAWMQSQGLTVLRLRNEQVLESLETVLQTILNALTLSPFSQGEGSQTPSPNPLPRERALETPPSPQGEGGRGDVDALAASRRVSRTAYAFKRHAIQASIYGVDIDPGAVDIAKLRLWLSLVVDEEDYTRIKPLPNLDYKIVCGNSLLSVEKNLFNHQVFAELEQQKQAYFEETNAERKATLRATIQGLIQTITNQAETFDFKVYFSEVFQQQGGFDVVIGNPPYVFARNSEKKGLNEQNKEYFYRNFSLASHQINLYLLFIEKGFHLLNKFASLCYITPNNWLTINENKQARKFILEQSNLKIVNFHAQVFSSVAVDSAIVIFEKGNHNRNVSLFEYRSNFTLIKKCPSDFLLKQASHIINIESLKNDQSMDLLTKIESLSIEIKDIADVKAGLKAYEVGAGKPLQTEEMKEARVYHAREKLGVDYFKYLEGKDVCRYHLEWSGEFLKYGVNLSRRRKFEIFSTPRILVRQIPSPFPHCINACFTQEVILNDLNSINILDIQESPELILAVLNSRLISYWFVHKFGKMQRKTFPQFKVNELAMFPIPKNFGRYRQELISNVNIILKLKESDPSTDISEIDSAVDQIVYEIYGLTDDEISLVEGKGSS